MKKLFALFFVLASFLQISAFAAVSEYAVTVTVDENNIIKPTNKGLLGYNDDASWQGSELRMYPGFSTPLSTDLQNPLYYQGLQDSMLEIPMMRGFFQHVLWKETIGDSDKRAGSAFGKSLKFGLVEWIKSVQSITKDAKFVIVVNLDDTADNISDLVRFLTLNPHDANAVGTDGVNWPLRRIELGITDPVDVICFEMGNEVDNSYRSGTTLAEWTANLQKGIDYYIPHANEKIDAVKAANPNAKTSVLSYSQPHDGRNLFYKWNSAIIPTLGPKVEYIVHHWYYHYGQNLYSDMIQSRFNNQIMTLVNNLNTPNKPKIFLSEHAIWAEPSLATTSNRFIATSLQGALTTGEVLNRLLNSYDAEIASYHCFEENGTADLYLGTCWGVVRHFDDGKVYPSAVGELYKMHSNAFGENVVKVSLASKSGTFDGVTYPNNPLCSDSNAVKIITASAQTTEEGGLNLIFNNPHPEAAHTVYLNSNKSYRLKKADILTGEIMFAENDPNTPNGAYTKLYKYDSQQTFTKYRIPPKSVVALYLEDASLPMEESKEAALKLNGTFYKPDMNVNCENRKLDMDFEFYENGAMGGTDKATLTVVPNGTNPASAALSDMAFFETKDVLRGNVHFEFAMPQSCAEGYYNARLTAAPSGTYEDFVFYYNPISNSKKITAVLISNDSESAVNNSSYKAELGIVFDKSVAEGQKYIVSVTDGDGRSAHIGESTKNGELSTYTFYMPIEAYGGKYTVAVSYDDGSGNTEMREKEFDFVKPNENIQIISAPKTLGGELVTLENIASLDRFGIGLKNVSSNAQSYSVIAAVYSKSGVLLRAIVGETKTLGVGEDYTYTVEIGNPTEQIGAVRLYTWNAGSIMPHTDYYIIK